MKLPFDLLDLVFFLGLLCLAGGFWLFSGPAAALLAVGVLLIVLWLVSFCRAAMR